MVTRRDLLLATGSALALGGTIPWTEAGTSVVLRKPIPASGELLPIIGMGTWQTFQVGDIEGRAPLYEVLRVFFQNGGTLIETSPLYGEAEAVVGDLVAQIGEQGRLFAATNVWADRRDSGILQMQQSFRRMGVTQMDLMQIHDLHAWQEHLPVLREWKEEGRIRYIGISTSEPQQYDAFAEIMSSEPLDFVQLEYNIAARGAEDVLLPLAAERGIAVLVNGPFGGTGAGNLFPRVSRRGLPSWAQEFDCRSWAQFFLKFAVSHPAVTCAIPATSNPMHAADNMGAGFGRLPDAEMRERMARHFAEI